MLNDINKINIRQNLINRKLFNNRFNKTNICYKIIKINFNIGENFYKKTDVYIVQGE